MDRAMHRRQYWFRLPGSTGKVGSSHAPLTAAARLQFGTNFQEMNALVGRQQTTLGIWLAHSTKIDSPLTLVMDLEGNDGRERGEDDTSFERKTALFALAVSDVVLINMWAKDIGRETGAGKPLLKTIFQVRGSGRGVVAVWHACTPSHRALRPF